MNAWQLSISPMRYDLSSKVRDFSVKLLVYVLTRLKLEREALLINSMRPLIWLVSEQVLANLIDKDCKSEA